MFDLYHWLSLLWMYLADKHAVSSDCNVNNPRSLVPPTSTAGSKTTNFLEGYISRIQKNKWSFHFKIWNEAWLICFRLSLLLQ
jgi:hypothetical protein